MEPILAITKNSDWFRDADDLGENESARTMGPRRNASSALRSGVSRERKIIEYYAFEKILRLTRLDRGSLILVSAESRLELAAVHLSTWETCYAAKSTEAGGRPLNHRRPRRRRDRPGLSVLHGAVERGRPRTVDRRHVRRSRILHLQSIGIAMVRTAGRIEPQGSAELNRFSASDGLKRDGRHTTAEKAAFDGWNFCHQSAAFCSSHSSAELLAARAVSSSSARWLRSVGSFARHRRTTASKSRASRHPSAP